jgi:DNA-directed RNA polymerase specialized sigma24 family protein
MSEFVFANEIGGRAKGDGNSGGMQCDRMQRAEVAPIEGRPGASEPAPWQNLPQHDFAATAAERAAQACDAESYDSESFGSEDWDRDPDLWLYRKKTTALLRRYMRWSLEAGRVPSLLGRELFRSRITAYTATTFEERVIFLHDMEGCLERLQGFDRQIVARVVLQEHDHDAAARILQCDRKTIERRLPELIDELTQAFLRAELLEKLPETKDEAL